MQNIKIDSFGRLADGSEVAAYRLSVATGAAMTVLNYGGIVHDLLIPDCSGGLRNVVLGLPTLEDYLCEPYFGPIIGRVANRIADGRFTLDGKTYQLACNNAPGGLECCLHGGKRGFNAYLWDISPFEDAHCVGVVLKRISPDGEENFPGNVDVTVKYTLTDDLIWRIEYRAVSDSRTPINLTQHAIFQLHYGDGNAMLNHSLKVYASYFAPVNKGLIPTGTFAPVEGTPFDFRTARLVGERINDLSHDQIRFGNGYDHYFVLDAWDKSLRQGASVSSPDGLRMEVWTTEPGIQIYSGNFISAGLAGTEGRTYGFRSGMAFETQHCPNSVNMSNMPSIIYGPGDDYTSSTEYRFFTAEK